MIVTGDTVEAMADSLERANGRPFDPETKARLIKVIDELWNGPNDNTSASQQAFL